MIKPKWLHNIIYWTNPLYMISHDLSNNPKVQKFVVDNFGHILQPIVDWLSKKLK